MMMSGLLNESTIKKNQTMLHYLKKLTVLSLGLLFTLNLSAQCENWMDSPNKDELENAHSIYRAALKSEDYALATEYWEVAYKGAPAADGKRDYHYLDGVKIYINKLKGVTDAEEKKAIVAKVNELYDQAIACYESKAIKPSKCTDDACYSERIGYVQNRRAYDMFYSLNSPYSKNLAVYDDAMERAGNDIEYTFFDPVAAMVVYQFQKEKMDKETTLSYFSKMEQIAAYNLENNSKYGDYYDQAWKAAKAKFAPIETDLFDCEYFKPQLEEMYEKDPENTDNLKTVIALLKKRNCPDSDPLLAKLNAKWKTYATSVNASRQAEFEANNPSILANKAYKAGNYDEAITRYREAISSESDNMKKANYHFYLASILFRKKKSYGDARKEARTAAQLRPGWGKPIMLIGDMYATGARNCGDSWNQRLAILAAIDKYNAAASDAEFASEARSKAAKYANSKPTQDEGFMRGVKAGQSVKVGCWIGETVKVRY
jgi:hypothetical protein